MSVCSIMVGALCSFRGSVIFALQPWRRILHSSPSHMPMLGPRCESPPRPASSLLGGLDSYRCSRYVAARNIPDTSRIASSMKAITYTEPGDSGVLALTERPVPEPGPGEVRVRVHISGVNPTDWKARREPDEGLLPGTLVPDEDGAGVIDAVGEGVDAARVGQRVWLWEAAYQRANGTAQEFTVLPSRQAVELPDAASFDLGASLGIPALTAHRALTLAPGGPDHLGPGALEGRTILVAGGAGAVGNAAIQLARWSGARVLTTVSSPEKAELATAAGAHYVINYRADDAAQQIKALAPHGVDLIVEVEPVGNAKLDRTVLAVGGTIAFYALSGADEPPFTLTDLAVANIGWHGVLVYTVPAAAKDQAVADVSAAVAAGALRVGAEAGLPLHRFPLDRTAAAHDAVEDGAVGKVLIDVV
jgi:NADPH:quinone reductase